jgi:LAO/AO transport system kinase
MSAVQPPSDRSRQDLARTLSRIEAADPDALSSVPPLLIDASDTWVVGITGAPGVGKSTLTNALITHLRGLDERVAVLAVDPSSPISGGALLGDRIRMSDHIGDPDVFIRSLASRGQTGGLALAVPGAIRAVAAAGYRWVILETVGVGQSAVDIAHFADTVVVLIAPGAGDAVQAAKAGVNEIADIFAVNKADQPDAKDTARNLEAALRLAPREPDSWRPKVHLVTALGGGGVDVLFQCVCEHRAQSMVEGKAQQLRAARRVREWHGIAATLVLAELDGLIRDADGQRLARDVSAGRVEPFDAAHLVAQRLVRHPLR